MKVRSILRHWLPIAIVVIALCGLVYLAVQQELRQTANDPRIQMAEDAADALSRGEAPASVLPASSVDIGQSLTPFMLVFGDGGEVLAKSGELHGQMPALPPGVLDYVRGHGEDRVTWQPEPGVRIAAVIVPVSDGAKKGFVLAGRSLREVEKRESQAEFMAGAAMAVTLAASLIVVALAELFLGPPQSPSSRGRPAAQPVSSAGGPL